MTARLRLIAGLGNPSARYEPTRHNAGFWFLDEVAERYRLRFSSDTRTQGLLTTWEWQGETVFLLKPMQYMNRSGSAVATLARFYKIHPEQILVAHDELDLAPGVVRLKRGGGHGGHNGLKDIIAQLGSSDFLRLRLGIGHPGCRDQVTNYVLDRPSQGDLGMIRAAILRAVDLLPVIVLGNVEGAMNVLHKA